MNRLPLRLQIALLSATISGVVLAGFGMAAYFFIAREKVAALDTEIRALGARHPGWLASRGNFDRLGSSLEYVYGAESPGRVIVAVKDAAGSVLYRSPNWPGALPPERVDATLADDPTPPAPAPLGTGPGPGFAGGGRGFGPGRGGMSVVFSKLPKFFTAQTEAGAWRLGVMGNDELRLVVGLSYAATRVELARMRAAFLLALPLALMLVGSGGWLVAGRALRPIRTISDIAEQVTAQGLDRRIPAAGDDPEIARLVRVLNGMMDRLEASFRQAIRFSADASHELKTPLTVMQGELENALQRAPFGSPEQEVYSTLLEETGRLKTITRGLVLLAQADAGRLPLALETVPLTAELEGLLEDARVLGAETGLRFEAAVQPDVWVRADRALLRTALLNLLINAVKYNEQGGRVGVELAADDAHARITIRNTGPGIPPAEQARVFERFYRVDRAGHREGLGLGLSLAREILHAHRGDLVLEESRPGRTVFRVTLPRATETGA
ncbi:MAG: HAMP domain-containing protein [Verrucomicrobia bacterium]|nr:HAMP domain-containing protein [Verrucomicrobiota bacterium]